MNIVEFAIKFKDLASSELGRFGAQSRRTFAQASQYADQLTGHNRVLGKSYDEIQLKIKQVENTIRTSTIPSQIRAARKELEILQRQSNSHIGNISGGGKSGGGLLNTIGLGSMAKMAGPMAIGAGIMGVGSFAKNAIGAAMERQQIKTSFNVLSGSEEKGSALTKQLVDLQKNTVLGSEVFGNAQKLMAYGFSDTEVTPALKMLGDLSMGNSEKFGRMSLAFGQIRSKGHLAGQELIQLTEQGLNPLKMMADRTGTDINILYKKMEKGQITYADVAKELEFATSKGGKFYQMLDKIGNTDFGKMEKLKGEWAEFKVQAGYALMPLASAALDLANKLLPIAEQFIQPLTTGIQTVVSWVKNLTTETGGWSDYIAIVKNYIVNDIYPFAQKVFGAITHIIKVTAEWMGKSDRLKDMFKGIYWFLGLILKIIGGIIDIIVWAFDKFMTVLNFADRLYSKVFHKNKIEVNSNSKSKSVLEGKNLPGGDTNTELLRQMAENTGENAKSAKNAEKAVTGGGPKIINVTVGKFLDSINLHTANLKEGTADIEGIFLEMFARVVAQGAKAM